MSHDIKHNLKSTSTWKRGLYMLLFTIFYSVAEVVFFFIVLFQFLLKLITGEINLRLQAFGLQMATYLYQITRFLSFNSENHVYPFAAWPQGEFASAPSDPEAHEPDEAKLIEDQDKT